MTRWKASGIHLTLSALVLGSIAAFAIWNWYPPGLIHVAKADKLLLTLTGVDIVLGPLLTLIIYKHGKKSLKFDLAVITTLQIAALGFGLNTLWQSRPVYLVAATDRFQLVFANEIAPADLKRAARGYEHLPLLGIRTVAAAPPQDPKLREQALLSALSGKDIYLIPANYVDYQQAAAKLAARGLNVAELFERLPTTEKQQLGIAIKRSGRPTNSLVAVPIDSIRGTATMLLDATTGGIEGSAGIDLWPLLQITK